MRRSLFVFFIGCLLVPYTKAQIPPIGQWRTHLPYGIGVETKIVGSSIFCSTPYSLFSYHTITKELQQYNRMTGLSETGISHFNYDKNSDQMVIAYTNSNIDIMTNKQIYSIDGIKRKNINGDKNIYSIDFINNNAFLGTGFGIVKVDLDKKEIKETYYPSSNGSNIKVNSICQEAGFLYACTAEGLKRAVSNSSLIDYHNWQAVPGLSTSGCNTILLFGSKLILLKNDSLLINQNGNWINWYDDNWHIERMHISGNQLLLCETLPNTDGRVLAMDNNGIVSTTIQSVGKIKMPSDAVQMNGDYYIADLFGGLRKLSGSNIETVIPNAPFEKNTGAMIFHNNKLVVCAGAVNDAWNYTYNRNGLFQMEKDDWIFYNQYNYPMLDSCMDIITVAANATRNELYYGSFGGGLIQLTDNNQLKIYKQNTGLKEVVGDPGNYRVSGLAFDQDQQLWISNYGSPSPLVVKKTDHTWKSFSLPFYVTENAVAQIILDAFNQVWVVAPKGNGLICFNHGNNIDNLGDDRWKFFRTGAGNGNLPDNEVYCIAKDKDGFIWVGTGKGIALISCAGEVFSTGCEASLPIVQNGNFNGYLLSNESVKSIAVDGANRKWVGTKNGIWLLSADGEKTIYRFTEDNSPLLSNDIKSIAIDPQTGEVFIATSKGLCSFRSTAKEGTEKNESVLVFPNPVPPDYNGLIAVKGLVNNAIVKFTELDGRLVYQTRSLGGQAIWDGRNYKGSRVSSGVYLILITDEQGKDKMIGKLFFIK